MRRGACGLRPTSPDRFLSNIETNPVLPTLLDQRSPVKKTVLIAAVVVAVVGAALAYVLSEEWFDLGALWESIESFISERELAQYIKQAGPWAPLVFIGLQALQIVVAPIPGEVTGIIGGYLFGTFPGLLYSTIGLTIGSCAAFGLGRWLGHHFARRFVTPDTYEMFFFLTRTHGKFITFLLFLIPGFPKDFLCYILGASPLSFGAFFLLSTVGRIPGTWFLSMQGRQVRTAHYGSFFTLVFVISGALLLLYLYREPLFRWIKLDHYRRQRRKRDTARNPGVG
ncbi:MAG: TVP38/TMEM64 family protein [Candidatus Methylomirabilota bacterium]|nr:TVP38/TMEM64 family protein [Candidatus Methylomirabilis sp.]NJD69226.1 TVP38/TMEM64 family protein [candidate division NC10 bacterium]PWB48510.1 MAG: TVP38/TMEM64 family protein [candidate division NC10 bacterium]